MNKVTQSIYKNAVDNSLFDSNGNFRFISGEGAPANVSGMTIISSKWAVNGNNLIFEIIGTLNNPVPSNTTICRFVLPEWISNKITLQVANLIDLTYNVIGFTSGGASALYMLIYKYSNALDFVISSGASDISEKGFFKIRYNTIIDY